RGDLRLRDARIGITFLAQQRGGVEVALARIVKHAVFQPVSGVAGFVDGLSDRGNFARGNVACGIEPGGLRTAQRPTTSQMAVNRREFVTLASSGIAAGSLLQFSSAFDTDTHLRAQIKAIAFDGFVVFDPAPVFSLAESLFPGAGAALSSDW